jgi:hypothetical protein
MKLASVRVYVKTDFQHYIVTLSLSCGSYNQRCRFQATLKRVDVSRRAQGVVFLFYISR